MNREVLPEVCHHRVRLSRFGSIEASTDPGTGDGRDSSSRAVSFSGPGQTEKTGDVEMASPDTEDSIGRGCWAHRMSENVSPPGTFKQSMENGGPCRRASRTTQCGVRRPWVGDRESWQERGGSARVELYRGFRLLWRAPCAMDLCVHTSWHSKGTMKVGGFGFAGRRVACNHGPRRVWWRFGMDTKYPRYVPSISISSAIFWRDVQGSKGRRQRKDGRG